MNSPSADGVRIKGEIAMERRRILQAAAMFGLPAVTALAQKPLPPDKLLSTDAETYWTQIRREQFLLAETRTYLNNGSLGVAPRSVIQAMADYSEEGATLSKDEYPRWGYETLDRQREAFAAFVGCNKQELAIMHSATEAMSTIAAGLDLKSGDEVLITDQEHPSGRGCWYLRQARHGIAVREAKIPMPPPKPEALVDLLVSAIGPNTKVLSFSGILTTTGLIMPVREICEAARRKGVVTVVDGAHMLGQVPVRISNLGCDYFAASPHKWMFAPPGSGLLYIREENLGKLWPTIVTGNWDDKKLEAARFMMVGTNNRAVVEGAVAGLKFLQTIGVDHVYRRIHDLARDVRARASAISYLELLTPDDDRSYGGLVTFRFHAKDLSAFRKACRDRRIWIYGGDLLRVSTHIHTRRKDLDALFTTIRETLG
jgi:isopenicillin-N epimerase